MLTCPRQAQANRLQAIYDYPVSKADLKRSSRRVVETLLEREVGTPTQE